MFLKGLEGWHFIVIAVVVLVIWGGPKLPGIAKNLGESMRVFRKEMRTMSDEKAADKKAKSDASGDAGAGSTGAGGTGSGSTGADSNSADNS